MKKTISISLALILLLGNVGFTYGTHFCMGIAMKSGAMLGEQHMDCGMGMMDVPDHEDDQMHFEAPDCCENEYVSIDADDFFKKNVSQELAPILVATALARILYSIDFDFDTDQPIPVDTSPPISDRDFQVLHQVFLI